MDDDRIGKGVVVFGGCWRCRQEIAGRLEIGATALANVKPKVFIGPRGGDALFLWV